VADLHLGRQFDGISLEADHDAVLDQIARAAADRDVEALVIAGDIFDRAAPPASAVRQFNAFLRRIASETRAAVVMIAGNHDQGDRIGAMAVLTDPARALVRGAVSACEPPLVLRDAHGPVAFSALPFAYEYAARAAFADETIETPEDVLRAQLAAARAALPEGARWVVTAHAFVAGGVAGETERPLARVGGIETVSPAVFEGAHYVALGHLHRPQEAGAPHIRYAGAPLAFGFDEAGAEKSISLVDLDGEGRAHVETIPLRPIRGVRVMRGRHAGILAAEPSEDFVRAVLTDEAPVIDGMKRLREVFPNACELVYEAHARAPETKSAAGTARPASPIELLGDFLEAVRGAGLTEAEARVAAEALEAETRGDDAA
jgi:exonuclease SbcD